VFFFLTKMRMYEEKKKARPANKAMKRKNRCGCKLAE